MKKRLLSLVLSCALVFTTIFAGAGHVFAGEEVSYVPFNFNQVDWEDQNLYMDKTVVFPDTLTSTAAQQSIKVAKKGHYVFMITPVATSGGDMTVEIVNANGKVVHQEQINLVYDEDTGTYMASSMIEIGLEKTGTYTAVVTPSEDYTGQMLCELFATYLPQSLKTSTSSILGKGELSFDNPSNGYSWFKVTTSGTRNLKLQLSAEKDATYQVTLFKKNKSTVLGKKNISVAKGKNYTTYFAVPKGTYYIRVFTKQSVTPYYAVKLTQSKVTEKSGAKKMKATAFGKNVLKKGTVLSTETATSSVDWYKVTIKKDQKFYMHLNFKTGGPKNGGVKITVYKKGSSKPQLSKKFACGENSFDWKLFTTGNNGKLEAGTYYFKVQKYNYGTGYYSMKWNNKSK